MSRVSGTKDRFEQAKHNCQKKGVRCKKNVEATVVMQLHLRLEGFTEKTLTKNSIVAWTHLGSAEIIIRWYRVSDSLTPGIFYSGIQFNFGSVFLR